MQARATGFGQQMRRDEISTRTAPTRPRGATACVGLTAALFTASCLPEAARQAGPVAPAATLAKAPPAPQPLLLKPVASVEAVAINAAMPVADAPNPRAPSLVFRAVTSVDQMRSLDCLAEAVFYEAASESEDGQRAVAQVVLNRVRHPSWPNSVCGVVYQGAERRTGCQFTFTCDGSLARLPGGAGWARARRIAAEALAGKVHAPVGHATHYHTVHVVPYWASSLVKSAVIGAHIFYRWTGGWGRPAAFRDRYVGIEPGVATSAKLAALSGPTVPAIGSAGVDALPLRVADLIKSETSIGPKALATTAPSDNLPDVTFTAAGLPESRVREAFRNSGAIKVRPSSEPTAVE